MSLEDKCHRGQISERQISRTGFLHEEKHLAILMSWLPIANSVFLYLQNLTTNYIWLEWGRDVPVQSQSLTKVY